MSNVDQLAECFADVCSSDVCVGTSSYTSSVIADDIKLPFSYSELSSDDVEYIAGEWGWGGYRECRGTFSCTDLSGWEWLLSRDEAPNALDAVCVTLGITSSGIGVWLAFGITNPLLGVGFFVVGAAVTAGSVWNSSVAQCALRKANDALFIAAVEHRSYRVFETYWFGITNGFDVERV